MKALKYTLGLFILSILVFNNSMAQKAIFTPNGGLTIGFGGGMAYQKSDLANSNGFGFDFILGSQLYKKENAFLSVDWKFRFLAGQNKAYDHRINPDNTFSNIRYGFFNYDLELGLTLNRLRERTRIVLTGFAGAGITHGRTFTDLYDTGNNLYDYTSIDPNRDSELVYKDLVALSDGDFETRLVNKAALLPTAGIFLGYQISRSLTVGVEFKTNFYLTEKNSFVGIDLDNRNLTGSGMDRNNYVSLGFSWSLRSGSSYNSAASSYSSGVTNNYSNTNRTDNPVVQVSSQSPSVNITNPSTDSYHTDSYTHTIRAIVNNVSGPDNISFYQNGIPNNFFTYNVTTKILSANISLREGENSIRIKATNQIAAAEDLVNITLIKGFNEPGSTQDQPTVSLINPEEIAVPTVRFINPATQVNVENNLFSLSAETQNVRRRNDVTLKLNGASIFNFAYRTNGAVSASLLLSEGVNTIEITAKNEAGMASDRTSITYHEPVYNEPVYREPVYREPVYREPVYSEPVYQEPVYQEPVYREPVYQEPVYREPVYQEPVNREPVYQEPVHQEPVHQEPVHQEPVNREPVIRRIPPVITEPRPSVATVPCTPPKVSFTVNEVNGGDATRERRGSSSRVRNNNDRNDATHELRGSISGVNNKADISITVNGRADNGFQFVPATGDLRAKFKFSPGQHTIIVSVNNACGTDSKSGSVTVDEETCGIRINPGNSAWQFCLVTPSGTFSRDNLTNANFSYSGPATTLYFMPIGGGGDAVVNGKPYPIRSGQYYLFTGSLNVSVSTKNPGSMGHWSVCINADRQPVSGNGNNRPKSPCEVEKDRPPKGNGNKR